jgi:hypothetical protein
MNRRLLIFAMIWHIIDGSLRHNLGDLDGCRLRHPSLSNSAPAGGFQGAKGEVGATVHQMAHLHHLPQTGGLSLGPLRYSTVGKVAASHAQTLPLPPR